jgi:hypothetical protein
MAGLAPRAKMKTPEYRGNAGVDLFPCCVLNNNYSPLGVFRVPEEIAEQFDALNIQVRSKQWPI